MPLVPEDFEEVTIYVGPDSLMQRGETVSSIMLAADWWTMTLKEEYLRRSYAQSEVDQLIREIEEAPCST